MAGKTLDAAGLRAWWAHRQGLTGELAGAGAAEVLEKTGWARSVGGAAPYLTLFSRAGISREAADAAVARMEIHELPSARGCTYVVPASHYALALKCAQAFGGAERKTAMKLGVAEKELDALRENVRAALQDGPLDPEQIKERVEVRNLGEAGKKKGLTTTLAVALGELQLTGEIRRISMNGRLDGQRYRYAAWAKNPLDGLGLTGEECAAELAKLYWRWTGPATLAEFQWFSGLGVKAAKAAVAGLGLLPAEEGSERLMTAEALEEMRAYRAPKAASYRLVASLDGITLLRRNVRDLLPDPNASFPMVQGLTDLPGHAIVDRGTLVGLWEFDAEAGEIAWMTFEKAPKQLEAEVSRAAEWIRDQLGDARSFSLDTPRTRAPRLAALRRAGH